MDYLGSPSPAKARPSLPTSPTHIQAMRYATQQKHGQNALNSIGSTNGMSSVNSSAANSPAMLNTLSPMSMQQMQQQQQAGSSSHNSPLLNSMQQIGFEYNANGLELAGFCSPSGEFMRKQLCMIRDFHFLNLITGQSTSSNSCNPGSNQTTASTSAGSPAGTSNGNMVSPMSQPPQQSQQQSQQQQQQQNFYQYLTPPSQHSNGGVTPQHLTQTLDSYPTPSPESPGHWSSSSPHSTSDWSEVQSPANNIYVTGGHQANQGSEAIYI